MTNHLAQSGGTLGFSPSDDLRRNASTIPDSLIPSRMAALVMADTTQKNSPSNASCTSSAKTPNPAIDISNSPELGIEPTSRVACTPPAKNDDACRVPLAAESGLGVCTSREISDRSSLLAAACLFRAAGYREAAAAICTRVKRTGSYGF